MRSRVGTSGEDLSGAKPVALDVNASIEVCSLPVVPLDQRRVATIQGGNAHAVTRFHMCVLVKDTLSLNAGVEQLYEVLAQQMPPVPAINVEFENLSYSVKVPSAFYSNLALHTPVIRQC